MKSIRFILLIAALGMISFAVSGCTKSDTVGGGKTGVIDPEKWASHTQGLDFTFGYETGLSKAASAEKPALIFVTTTWCGYCKKLANDCFTDGEVQERLGFFELVLVDGDVEKETCRYLGVDSYPTLIMKHEDGRTFGRIDGAVSKEEFIQLTDEALGKYERMN